MSSTTSNEKISEALALLEEAAKDKRDEVRNLITGKYENLRGAVVQAEHTAAEVLTAAQKRAVEAILHAKEVGQEKVKHAATVVDDQVHATPWPFIGGAALTALLVGYILGRRK